MEDMKRILLVEDEERMADAVRRVLVAEHYTVDTAPDGETALAFCGQHTYDVVLLDRMLPGMSGDEVLRTMRQRGNATPVLMVTALSALEHRVEGLDAGADDYLPKPFAFSELLARLRALVRRRPDIVADRLSVGEIQLDPDRHQVTVGDRSELLSAREYALLGFLIRHAGQVVTRQQILDYLRRKLAALGQHKALRTVRGVGYALRPSA
jgi:two-component system OmpR family response regulator